MLPKFNDHGDLPIGVYAVSWEVVEKRFGGNSPQRQAVTARLKHIYRLVQTTGMVQRFLVFGSYVTDNTAPNDVDVVLIMQNAFSVDACRSEAKMLFDHEQADRQFGASIFWIRPSLLILETLDEFIAHWQVKRDQSKRGIVEIAL